MRWLDPFIPNFHIYSYTQSTEKVTISEQNIKNITFILNFWCFKDFEAFLIISLKLLNLNGSNPRDAVSVSGLVCLVLYWSSVPYMLTYCIAFLFFEWLQLSFLSNMNRFSQLLAGFLWHLFVLFVCFKLIFVTGDFYTSYLFIYLFIYLLSNILFLNILLF